MKERKTPWWFWKRSEEAPAPGKNDYTVISTVNDRLLYTLRQHLVPGILESREEIGLCTPPDHGDMVLGIYLYDIQENDEMRVNGMIDYGENYQQYPPLYLNLSYMITAYSSIDLRYREEENHRILAKVMEVFHDYPLLEGDDRLHMEPQNLTMEQKMAVWHNNGMGYRLSLFYRVTPVRLNSTVKREITRVKEIQIETPYGTGGRT